jgi:hypothetical protein
MEGVAGPVAWRADELGVGRRVMVDRERRVYTFTLVLRETQGQSIDFTRMVAVMYDAGTDAPAQTETGRWRLPAGGELRIPFVTVLGECGSSPAACVAGTGAAPHWHIVLAGTREPGRPLELVIDVRLPPERAALSRQP